MGTNGLFFTKIRTMSDSLLKCLGNGLDVLPSCEHYHELLDISHSITGWDYEHIRCKYGQYTYKQWADII